jgi:RimJ/RimL family protein N-acetyltransferase
VVDPLLLDFPAEIVTERLVLRPPRAGDGAVVNKAVVETIDTLQKWMPWSRPTPTVEQTELWCRRSAVEFLARRELPLLMFSREGETFIGSSSSHSIDWTVPRLEIGYWVRRRFEGQGYVTEAVTALAEFAFETLKMARVQIRMNERNERSWRVAERAGFQLEGVLRHDSRDVDGALRTTRMYARICS